MEHISKALARGLQKVQRRRIRLAPLAPDQFLRWAWLTGYRHPGTHALTLGDLHFEMTRKQPDLTLAELHKDYVRLAALVRRNQRLGNDPWAGVL